MIFKIILKIFVPCFFIFTLIANAQNGNGNGYHNGFWQLQSINGSVSLESQYRTQETILRNNISEKPQTTIFNGLFKLNTQSVIWHPSFMKLNADAEYMPGFRKDEYIVIPNRTENINAEKIRLLSQFFSQRPFSFNLFSTYNHSFLNRELTTNVETRYFHYGANMRFSGYYLPLTFTVFSENQEQKELQTGRVFDHRRSHIQLETSKSFRGDANQLVINYDDLQRKYMTSGKINSYITSAYLRNNIGFGPEKTHMFSSFFWFQNQEGYQAFRRLQINESLGSKLPYNFRSRLQYSLTDNNRKNINSVLHSGRAGLEHQLFKSLHSNIFYEIDRMKQSAFDEKRANYGAGIKYRKQLSFAVLNLGYTHTQKSEDRQADPLRLSVINSEYILDDSKTILLNDANVESASILVTDSDGFLVYQENLDYLLIPRGSYTEIQRIPGGRISDGQTVLISYESLKPLSYRFSAYSNNLSVSLAFMQNTYEIYFRYFDLGYSEISGTAAGNLKTISQRVVGFRYLRDFLTSGIEYDIFSSNIIPYNSIRIYSTVNYDWTPRLRSTVTLNWRKTDLSGINENQRFADITASSQYRLTYASQIKLSGGYRDQSGRGLDLSLFTLKSEYILRVRQVFISAGLETYRRNFSGEINNYNAGFLKLERKF